MDNIFDKIIGSIFIESGLLLARATFTEELYGFSTDLYLAHNPNGDYFIYVKIPENALPYICNNIQIKLSRLIKNEIDFIEQSSGKRITISSSFDKNSTLIILTDQLDASNKSSDIYNQAIAIEEDPYFFKKQVLVISSKELEVASSRYDKFSTNYLEYLNNVISNTESFNCFINSKENRRNNLAIEYSFVAKLYEKLPFLSLSVQETTPDDLQKNINDDLTKEQYDECESLLQLDVKKLDSWIKEILKEENND